MQKAGMCDRRPHPSAQAAREPPARASWPGTSRPASCCTRNLRRKPSGRSPIPTEEGLVPSPRRPQAAAAQLPLRLLHRSQRQPPRRRPFMIGRTDCKKALVVTAGASEHVTRSRTAICDVRGTIRSHAPRPKSLRRPRRPRQLRPPQAGHARHRRPSRDRVASGRRRHDGARALRPARRGRARRRLPASMAKSISSSKAPLRRRWPSPSASAWSSSPANSSGSTPDLVLLIGDRYEALAAAIAAAYMNICIVHIQGGEVSGSIDESARHAITKFAHFHFPSTRRSAEYLVRMGESPTRSSASAAPRATSRDARRRAHAGVRQRHAAAARTSIPSEPFQLVIFHPTTTEYGGEQAQMRELLEALEVDPACRPSCSGPTSTPAPTRSARRSASSATRPRRTGCARITNLPPDDYLHVLAATACAIGNSSSFVRDASYFGTPVVLVGDRQEGRETDVHVARVAPLAVDVTDGDPQATPPRRAMPASTLYGDGNVSDRIAEALVRVTPYRQKRLHYIYDSSAGRHQMTMQVLGIITARGGSKGIPRKNIASLMGKPLLAYTAEAALAAQQPGARRASPPTIPKIARGRARLRHRGPVHAARRNSPRDNTPSIPVMQDVVRRLEAEGARYDATVPAAADQSAAHRRRHRRRDRPARAHRRRFGDLVLRHRRAASGADEVDRR